MELSKNAVTLAYLKEKQDFLDQYKVFEQCDKKQGYK